MKKRSTQEQGIVLIVVMLFVAIMAFSTVSLSTMVQTDVKFIQAVTEREQARYMAEAGINHALAKLQENGFVSRTNFTDRLDNGSYSVEFLESSGKHLVVSTGTVSGASSTVSAELEDLTPTSLDYIACAGNNIKIQAYAGVEELSITGDIHANNDVILVAQIFSKLSIDGDVSASNIVREGTRHDRPDTMDRNVEINGVARDGARVYEDTKRASFPEFDYTSYKDAADDSDDYYESSQIFSSKTMTPKNGIVYVDGDVTIEGSCTINGGIIADNIYVNGTLNQFRRGDRNVVIAKDGDIDIGGELYVREACVYASQDIKTHATVWWVTPVVRVKGIMLAKRNIDMFNVKTDLAYTYTYIYPLFMTDETSGVRVVSWNR